VTWDISHAEDKFLGNFRIKLSCLSTVKQYTAEELSLISDKCFKFEKRPPPLSFSPLSGVNASTNSKKLEKADLRRPPRGCVGKWSTGSKAGRRPCGGAGV